MVSASTKTQALENENYFGSFLPDELPAALEGGFGLVWDGDSAETCSGVFGSTFAIITLTRRHFTWPQDSRLWFGNDQPYLILCENSCGIAVDHFMN